MKSTDLKNKSHAELLADLGNARKEADLLSMKLKSRTSKKSAQFRALKKDIARLMMHLHQVDDK